jgi:hypothetical protein
MPNGYAIKGADQNSRKVFTEADVQRLLKELREDAFGELSIYVERGEIVRMRKATTHLPRQ